MVERLAHESGISAIMNTHYPTNAMSVADEALMLNRKGEFFYGPAAEILSEENISYSFDVQVLVDELHYQGRSVRSIVPVVCGRKLLYEQCPFYTFPVRPIRDAMTVSRPSGLGYGVPVTWFSLGAGTLLPRNTMTAPLFIWVVRETAGFFWESMGRKCLSNPESAVCTAKNTVRHKNRQWNDLYRNHFEKGEFYHEQHHQGWPAHRAEGPHFL